MAIIKTESLRQERREYCATLIQAMWRQRMASDNFIKAMSDIILIQSIARRCSALKVSRRLKEEKQKFREASSTKISSTWRRFFAAKEYRYNVAGKLNRRPDESSLDLRNKWSNIHFTFETLFYNQTSFPANQ